jgi:hypothetical protein
MGTSRREDLYSRSSAPGPCAYDVAGDGDIGKKQAVSTRPNTPKPRFGTAARFPRSANYFTPAPGAYSLTSTVASKQQNSRLSNAPAFSLRSR